MAPCLRACAAMCLLVARLLGRRPQALPLPQAHSLLTPVNLLAEHPWRAWPLLPAGRKIMTTSQDNRIRVWDYLYSTAQVGNLQAGDRRGRLHRCLTHAALLQAVLVPWWASERGHRPLPCRPCPHLPSSPPTARLCTARTSTAT